MIVPLEEISNVSVTESSRLNANRVFSSGKEEKKTTYYSREYYHDSMSNFCDDMYEGLNSG